MLKKTTFWFSIVGWLYGTGLLILLRFFQTEFSPEWVDSNEELFLWWLIVGVLVGIVFFVLIEFQDNSRLRRSSYGVFIGLHLAGVLVLFVVAVLATSFYSYFRGKIALEEVVPLAFSTISHPRTLGPLLFFLTWSGIMTFIRQMMVKVGPRILRNLLLGKYFQPRSENRVFLFIDLKASTRLAELLGHQKYGRLIQDCFYDLTNSILKYEVEVYQYIGDEAVLTWTEKKGLRNGNCIRVYYDFIRTLNRRREYYLHNYGYVPFFKAGANAGTVTVTEIGVVKREIAYLSEVLHTAARIQGTCNQTEQGLLISDSLKKKLENQPDLSFEPVGTYELRGKFGKMELYSARPAEFEPIPYPEPI